MLEWPAMFLRDRAGKARVEGALPFRSTTVSHHVLPLVLVCTVAGLISGFFLAIYHPNAEPIGWDTARYLDQANLIRAHGLIGAASLKLPRPSGLLASRVGFPTSVLTLSALFRASPFKLAAVVPVAAVAAAALAAAAFVSYSLRWGAWEFAVVAGIAGTSTAMLRLMAGTYTDNLIATAAFAAALIPILIAVREGRGYVAAIVFLAAGGLAHPSFYAFMLAVLGLTLLIYMPESWRTWRRHEQSFLSTPAARLGMVMAGSGGINALMLGVLGTAPDIPQLNRRGFSQRLRDDVPLYHFPITVPLAAVGIASLARRLRRPRPPGADGDGEGRDGPRQTDAKRFNERFLLVLLLAWGAVTAAGIAAFALGKSLPAHRFLAFLLPLPILVALGILALARLLGRRTAPLVGVLIVLGGVVGVGYLAYRDYVALAGRGLEYLDRGKVRDAAMAAAYLDVMRVPKETPIVFIMTDTGPQPRFGIPEFAHILRATIPAARVPHSYFYVGTADNYLAGRPTLVEGDNRGFNIVSGAFWRSVQPILSSHPVALVLSSYYPAFGDLIQMHPDWFVAPDVAVPEGPRPAAPLPTVRSYPTAPRGPVAIFMFGTGTLTVLALIGLGWVIGLLPGALRPFEALALSVAFGLALLVLGGTIVDVLGIRLSGVGGAAVGPAVGALGWVFGGRTLLRRRLGAFAL
jgi:hypothetical protein